MSRNIKIQNINVHGVTTGYRIVYNVNRECWIIHRVSGDCRVLYVSLSSKIFKLLKMGSCCSTPSTPSSGTTDLLSCIQNVLWGEP